jgi:hypothetical protein
VRITHCGICSTDSTIDSGWGPSIYPCTHPKLALSLPMMSSRLALWRGSGAGS